ncbi:hypothetical protein MSAN_01889500 [Mycena sanguinolenta]|uniref:Uncharacterized protein n=1 Tax=Mycena sanguinolenta TaxID=230812 RepID=A0A8H6XQZ1_9AGAR|nr:hypothetical protein MSAN_01889500 [Mycena sanguinolenta]
MDWTTFAVAEPGYESDSGARDIPTLTNFETVTPVTVVHGNPQRGGNRKVLNRRGRAICRIMAAHGWSYRAIAYIFRISESSVSRAAENQFYKPPRDRVEEDLERAGTEFGGVLPSPPSDARLKELLTAPKAPAVIYDLSDESDLELSTQRAAKKRCHTRLQEVAADENNGDKPSTAAATPSQTNTIVQPQPQESCTAFRSRSAILILFMQAATNPTSAISPNVSSHSTAVPRHNLNSPHVLIPHRYPLRSDEPVLKQTPPSRSPFPTSSSKPSHPLPPTSPHISSSSRSKDSYPPHLCALATWNPQEVHEALNDLLMERPRALGLAGITAFTFVKFELAIRKLVGIAPTPRKPSLPRVGVDTTLPALSLSLFLTNVMGFDLSTHTALLSTQGYDVAALRAMLSWPPAELRARRCARRCWIRPWRRRTRRRQASCRLG